MFASNHNSLAVNLSTKKCCNHSDRELCTSHQTVHPLAVTCQSVQASALTVLCVAALHCSGVIHNKLEFSEKHTFFIHNSSYLTLLLDHILGLCKWWSCSASFNDSMWEEAIVHSGPQVLSGRLWLPLLRQVAHLFFFLNHTQLIYNTENICRGSSSPLNVSLNAPHHLQGSIRFLQALIIIAGDVQGMLHMFFFFFIWLSTHQNST